MHAEIISLRVDDPFLGYPRQIKAEYCVRDLSRQNPCLIYMGGISADTFGPEAVKPLEVIEVAEQLCFDTLRYNYVAHGREERYSEGTWLDASISGGIADVFAVIDSIPSHQPVILIGSSISVSAFSFLFRRYPPGKIKAALGLIPVFPHTFLEQIHRKFPDILKCQTPQDLRGYFSDLGGALRYRFEGMSHVELSLTLAQYNDFLSCRNDDLAPVSFSGPLDIILRENDPVAGPNNVLPRLQSYHYQNLTVKIMPGFVHNIASRVIYNNLLHLCASGVSS